MARGAWPPQPVVLCAGMWRSGVGVPQAEGGAWRPRPLRGKLTCKRLEGLPEEVV